MYHSVLMGSLGEGLCLSDKHWPSLVLSNERGQLVGLEHLISRPTGARVELLGWGFSNSHCKDIIIVFNDKLERDLFILNQALVDVWQNLYTRSESLF